MHSVRQRNYYEHVIRDDDSLNRIREYVINNPLQWASDCDVKNSKVISIDDLLGDYDNYLGKLSFYVIDELMQRLDGADTDYVKDMVISGARPKPENFRHFTFKGNLLKLFFSKYEVAPGGFGEQVVYVPMSIFTDKEPLDRAGFRLASLKPGTKVNFPLKVNAVVSVNRDPGYSWGIFEGEAGSMGILNEDGVELGTGILKAEGDWMTGKPVKVSGVIKLKKPAAGNIYMEIRENYLSGSVNCFL